MTPNRSSVESMTNTDVRLSVPEVARRLEVDGGDVYRLIFQGVLSAKPGSDGAVYVEAYSVDEYRATFSKGPPPQS